MDTCPDNALRGTFSKGGHMEEKIHLMREARAAVTAGSWCLRTNNMARGGVHCAKGCLVTDVIRVERTEKGCIRIV